MASCLRCGDKLDGRGLDLVAEQQKVIKSLDAAQFACLRRLFALAFVQEEHISLDHHLLDLRWRNVVHTQNEVGELGQIAHVCLDAIRCQILLQTDICSIRKYRFLPFFAVFCHIMVTFAIAKIRKNRNFT